MNLKPLGLMIGLVSFLALLFFLNACPKPEIRTVQQTIGQSGGTMTLQDASLSVPAGSFTVDAALTLTKDRAGETVGLTENEEAVSSIFTLTHDQESTLSATTEPFALELPFDTAGIPQADINHLCVFVKVQIEGETYPLLGEVSSGRIGFSMLGLPPHAVFLVCHNPNMEGVASDPIPGSKLLTPSSAWHTTDWYVAYDKNDVTLRKTVGIVLNKFPVDVTEEDVAHVVKERVSNGARDASLYLQGLHLRQPNLEIKTFNGPYPYLVMYLFPGNDFQSWFAPCAAGNGIGQVRFSSSLIDNPPAFFLGTVKDTLAHEIFHACFDGYGLFGRDNGETVRTDVGYNEGCAVVIGNTFDKGDVNARQNFPPFDYTMMLDDPLGSDIPLGKAYANDDFFAYVGRRFGDNKMWYLGGEGFDENGDRNGVLEQIRKCAGSFGVWTSRASFYQAYREGTDKSFRMQFGVSLADVYWDFARARAFENTESSRLRPGDNATMYSLNLARFSTGMVRGHSFLFVDDPPVTLDATPATLKAFGPFSTRALTLSTTNFTADLDLKFNVSEWPVDAFGNSVEAVAYREDGSSVELAPGTDVIRLHLDNENVMVVVLVSNVNMTSACSVSITASVSPPQFVGGNVFDCVAYCVEGATVTARTRGQPEILATALSDASGVFKIFDLPDGEIELTVEAYAYLPRKMIVNVVEGQSDWVFAYIMPDGQGCLSSNVVGRWWFYWDEDCDGARETESYWHLNGDGTVSWVSTGLPLPGYGWQMDGDQKIIITRADGTSLVGTFTPDCNGLMLGEVAGGYGEPSCWKAATNDPGK